MEQALLKDAPAEAANDGKEIITEGGTEVSIGKFKNADELYKAYLSLEQEFTRRSQRLRELEKGQKSPLAANSGFPPINKGGENVGEGSTLPSVGDDGNRPVEPRADCHQPLQPIADSLQSMSEEELLAVAIGNETVRSRIIEEYIGGLNDNLPKTLRGGVSAVSVPVRPRTLAEAGQLAGILLRMK